MLQAVCDHRLAFTDCYAGWPGATHDARVLRRSDLFSRVTADKEAMFPQNSYLLGDSPCPLTSWSMPPFHDNGHLTPQQCNYNFLHSSSRMVIERAFALLKGRFRCLKYVDMDVIELVPDVVMAACTYPSQHV